MPPLTDIQLQDVTTFIFDDAVMRYRGTNGRFVSEDAIRSALQQVIQGVGSDMDTATLDLMAGEIALVEWEQLMASNIKLLHVISASLNAGGWGRLTDGDMSFVERTIARELDLLTTFARQIETGQQALDGSLVQRKDMYKNSSNTSQQEVEVEHAQNNGLVAYQNVLGPAEHCDGCLEETGKGWVPIGDLVPIGSRQCLTNCHCSYEYGDATMLTGMAAA